MWGGGGGGGKPHHPYPCFAATCSYEIDTALLLCLNQLLFILVHSMWFSLEVSMSSTDKTSVSRTCATLTSQPLQVRMSRLAGGHVTLSGEKIHLLSSC